MIIDTEGVTPKGLKARAVREVPEAEQAQIEPAMWTGIDQAATDAGLAQDWPRESDASDPDWKWSFSTAFPQTPTFARLSTEECLKKLI